MTAVLPLGPPAPLPTAILTARAAIEAAGRALLEIPDSGLKRPWSWLDAPEDVRYGFFRILELLEEAEVDIARGFSVPRAVGGCIAQQASAAAWNLQALLLSHEPDLDRPPGGNEWTIRQTLGHIISAQDSYVLRGAFWIHLARQGLEDLRPNAPGMPAIMQEPEAEQGTLDDIRHRLQARLDVGIGLLGMLDEHADLDAPIMWSGHRLTARFRMQRWSSHLREHTIQIEKTLVLLGRPVTEVERVLRLICEAYGRLEGACYGLAVEKLDTPAAARVAAAAAEAETVAASVRAAA